MPLAGSNPLRLVTHSVLRAWAACFGHDIFVSYAREDGWHVARALRELYENRFLVFLDECSIDGGEDFETRIDREIRKARLPTPA